MGDLFQDMGSNYSHEREKRDPWGTHTKSGGFIPTHNYPCRCPSCNRLIDAGYLEEKRCPECNLIIEKALGRDISIEAEQVQSQGGWSRRVLDILSGKPPSTIAPDGSTKPVSGTARNLTELSIEAQRRGKAAAKLINALRNKSAATAPARGPVKARKLP